MMLPYEGAKMMGREKILLPDLKPFKIFASSRQSTRLVKVLNRSATSAPEREKDPKKRIVITGMGLISVLGNDVSTFYDRLLSGESGISLIDKFNTSDYSVQIAGQIRNFSAEGYIDTDKYADVDDSWKYCLVAAKKALQQSNLGPQVLKSLDRSKMGVVVGSGGGASTLSKSVAAFLKQEYAEISTPYYSPNVGPALLAIETGFRGPVYSISAACASSNYCFSAAANHIKRGEAEIMVAGGTDAGVIPSGICGFTACKSLSTRNDEPKKASRPWDKKRDGFVLSEGSAILVTLKESPSVSLLQSVLESLEHATKRGANIVAEYLGGATTCDAHHLTDPRADGLGVSTCISKSLHNAGVSPQEVNYINAHATSTRIGDLAEVKAINKVFGANSEVKMNATKHHVNIIVVNDVEQLLATSMIGHAIGAAGGLEAIAVIKAITSGWLHPTINQYNLEAEVKIDTIPNLKIKHDVNVAISNSFGFGGHNSVVVFAPFKP